MSMDNAIQDNCPSHRLNIYSFGQFMVKHGNQVLSDNSKRSSKHWELFKYLLTQRGRGILPETILDALWPDKEYSDPKRAVRTMVFRLRQILDNENICHGNGSYITLSQGCYKWNSNMNYWLDAEEFESMSQKAQKLAGEKPEEAAEIYQKALSLYKGGYFPESSFYEWVLPVRNYYSRIYLQSVLEVTELLKKIRDYNAIIKVAENALLIEPYEEEFHVRFMEALLKIGKTRQARDHYEHVTSSFYRDLGVKPSPTLRNLYRIMKTDTDNYELDLTSIQESIKDRDKAPGAFFCDSEIFRLLYNMERRRSERTGHSGFLGLFTVTRPGYRTPSPNLLTEAMENLKEAIQDSLRRGDVFCRWNDDQFLLMLPGLSREKVEPVLKRIEQGFWKNSNFTEEFSLMCKVQEFFSCWSHEANREEGAFLK